MGSIFFEITIIICLAAVLSIIFRLLKQPPILAYILTGIIIGPFGNLQLHNQEALRTMGEFGIAFLLFMLGLELRIDQLKSIGKSALFIGIGQIILTFIAGYSLSVLLGFSSIVSFYVGIALTFSSTIIIVKLLSDKKDLHSLYGKLSIGVLLVQDVLAILTLIVLSGFSSGFNFEGITIKSLSLLAGILIIKVIFIFGLVIYLGKNVFPKFIDKIAKSQELLFLVSIAWVFGMTALVSSPLVGFSIEIGGLLAGLALANSLENLQIIARVKALRDFFITLFFVFLGSQMVFVDLGKIIFPAILFSALVIFLKPLLSISVMGVLGYRKRTSFLTGITLGQISEFSLIIIFLGNKLGHIENDTVSLVTLIAIITFTVSNYAILNDKNLFNLFSSRLNSFERKVTRNEKIGEKEPLKDHIVLIGAHRVGQSILDSIGESEKVVVVDFDPEIVKKVKDKNVHSFFGDVTDLEIQEIANIKDAKIVVSTVPDLDDNLALVKGLKRKYHNLKIIVVAYDIFDAKALYKAGVDYVVLPHLAGGRQIAKILKEDKSQLEELRLKDINSLN